MHRGRVPALRTGHTPGSAGASRVQRLLAPAPHHQVPAASAPRPLSAAPLRRCLARASATRQTAPPLPRSGGSRAGNEAQAPSSARAAANSQLQFSSPKTGAVGEQRFRDSAAPGTYWSDELARTAAASGEGATVLVEFDTGAETVQAEAAVGENLLRVAERCGAMKATQEFCFEGSCCHCEMEVVGGATEAGYRAYASEAELVRSCLCAVPSRQGGKVTVRVLSEDGAWQDSVL